MSFKVKATRPKFDTVPPGTHGAQLVGLIDCGTQSGEFDGEVRESHMIYLVFELPNVKSQASEGHMLAGLQTGLTLHVKSRLRAVASALLGRAIAHDEEIDIATLLGRNCVIEVKPDKGYSRIVGVWEIDRDHAVGRCDREKLLVTLDDVKKHGTKVLPDWLPWIFGETVADHVSAAKELQPGYKAPKLS